MTLSEQKNSKLLLSSLVAATLLLGGTVANAEPMIPNFENEGKNIVNYPTANQRWVVLPTDTAKMVANRFALPFNTLNYGIANMTMFPYYQASPELKEFLNNSRVNGIPITDFSSLNNTQQTPIINRLTPTDLIHLNIPIPQGNFEKKSAQLAMKNVPQDETPWLVAHQSGQSFAIPGDPSGLVVVAPGTMFNAAGQRTLALRCGTMWVMTGPRRSAVLTKYGAVEIKPYSIVGIEQTWFNRVKVASLYGESVDMQFAYKGNNSKVEIAVGKETSMVESARASAGTSDYVQPSSSPEDGKQIAALPVTPVSLNVEMISKNVDADVSHFVSELKGIVPPISSPKISMDYKAMFAKYGVTPEMRRDAIQNQNLQRSTAIASAKKQPAYNASLSGTYFVPASKSVIGGNTNRGPIIFPKVSESLETLWVQHGAVKYLSDARLEIEKEGRLSLNSGEAIFAAKEPMYVRSRECFINIKPGAIVQVIAKKNVVIVRNLRELANNSVLLKVKSRTMDCAAGGELIVSDIMSAAFTEMKSDGITRRNVRTTEFAGGSVVINKSEIELTTLMQYNPIMHVLCESKNKFDQKLVGEVVKQDAVLSMVTKHHGNYQRMAGLPAAH